MNDLPTGMNGMVLGWHWPWISIEDRLPDKEGAYIVYRSNTKWVKSELFLNDQFYAYDVTHWMPFPEKPEEN